MKKKKKEVGLCLINNSIAVKLRIRELLLLSLSRKFGNDKNTILFIWLL